MKIPPKWLNLNIFMLGFMKCGKSEKSDSTKGMKVVNGRKLHKVCWYRFPSVAVIFGDTNAPFLWVSGGHLLHES